MENPKSQLVAKLKEANNVLVTVSKDPSVDQLAAAIGLTLLLNKMGKHSTAVYSGKTPSTIEFLKPEETLEKNTDSLRDFIISLDKSKADKLRYKVEENHVKIFITPFRTSISEKDLEFSQGDFNVDVVVALGVHKQQDLDQAITAHGRILHDATVATVNTKANGNLGTINWVDEQASSLSEMMAAATDELQTESLDNQIATAYMTGIVAETNRFSNEKTTAVTMSLSAKLMAAGANQQLVATKLQEKEVPSADHVDDTTLPPVADSDDALQIEHDSDDKTGDKPLPYIDDIPEVDVPIDESVASSGDKSVDSNSSSQIVSDGSKLILEPPTLGGKLTANTESDEKPMVNPLDAQPKDGRILNHFEPPKPAGSPLAGLDSLATLEDASPTTPKPAEDPIASALQSLPPSPPPTPLVNTQKVDDLLGTFVPAPVPETGPTTAVPTVDQARNAVIDAVSTSPNLPIEPISALNATPVDLGNPVTTNPLKDDLASPMQSPQLPEQDFNSLPPPPLDPIPPVPPTNPSVSNPTAPPPVPPPMMPPTFPPTAGPPPPPPVV